MWINPGSGSLKWRLGAPPEAIGFFTFKRCKMASNINLHKYEHLGSKMG